MKYRIIPLMIVVIIILIGYVIKRIRINKLKKRRRFTIEYQNNFIDLMNWINKTGEINQELYGICIHDVNKIQAELGYDGVISDFIDPLHGIQGKNYQLFVNIMPEIRSALFMWNNSIAKERLYQLVGLCDDSLRKHIGNIDNWIEEINRNMYNPFSCFGEGIRLIIALPIDILCWCGIIEYRTTDSIKMNRLFKVISNLIVLIGFIGSLITIVLGWNDFVEICKEIIKMYK